jgi:hypothetical protein
VNVIKNSLGRPAIQLSRQSRNITGNHLDHTYKSDMAKHSIKLGPHLKFHTAASSPPNSDTSTTWSGRPVKLKCTQTRTRTVVSSWPWNSLNHFMKDIVCLHLRQSAYLRLTVMPARIVLFWAKNLFWRGPVLFSLSHPSLILCFY